MSAKEANHYLIPMPFTITDVVWLGKMNALTQDRMTGSPFACFWKAVLQTPKISDVISEPDIKWTNNN